MQTAYIKHMQTHRGYHFAAIIITTFALAAGFTGKAEAQPLFANLYKQQYGYTPACMACHRDGGGSPINSFGEQFKAAGETAAALTAIANKDADGDGIANAEEALAKANPGNKNSTPSDKGDWLDISSLIPKEVQGQFPDIKEYLPRDAFLTETDISRAQSMGAILSKADNNTIYIPLKERRPAGTALIFQADHKGKAFFLMLTTDRTLKVTQVAPISTKNVPEADSAKVYESFVGMSLDQLPSAKGESLEASITSAVKRAGTLVYVRLKGA